MSEKLEYIKLQGIESAFKIREPWMFKGSDKDE